MYRTYRILHCRIYMILQHYVSFGLSVSEMTGWTSAITQTKKEYLTEAPNGCMNFHILKTKNTKHKIQACTSRNILEWLVKVSLVERGTFVYDYGNMQYLCASQVLTILDHGILQMIAPVGKQVLPHLLVEVAYNIKKILSQKQAMQYL